MDVIKKTTKNKIKKIKSKNKKPHKTNVFKKKANKYNYFAGAILV